MAVKLVVLDPNPLVIVLRVPADHVLAVGAQVGLPCLAAGAAAAVRLAALTEAALLAAAAAGALLLGLQS